MKPCTIERAIQLANLLCPPGHNDESDLIGKEEVEAQVDILKVGISKVRQLTNIMEPTRTDLQLVRAMLAAELYRPEPRLPVVMALINRHETLYKLMRLDKLLIELPEVAVEIDKGLPKVAQDPVRGASLQAAITGALHYDGGGA
jgi:hypothetical protein